MPFDPNSPGQALLFMKVGIHAREPLEAIIARKHQEFLDTGSIYWGYGGGTCHPRTMVQPFAKQQGDLGKEVVLVMEEIKSDHFAEPIDAVEYSEDNVTWNPVPNGIHVKGSKYALILDDLQLDEFDLDLRRTNVSVGPTRGKSGDKYIRGRVDKGCLEYDPDLIVDLPEGGAIHRVRMYAKIKAPYAVFLR